MCWRHVSCIFFVNIFSSGNLNVLNARRKDGMLLIIYALWYSVRNIGMGYISWSWFFMNLVTQVYFQYTPALQYNLFVNQTAQWRKLELRISYTVAAPSSPPGKGKPSFYFPSLGFPAGSSGKESTCRCRRCKRCGFEPWVGRISWRRWWQPTPVTLPGECHGQRSLAGYSPWGAKRQTSPSDSAHTHSAHTFHLCYKSFLSVGTYGICDALIWLGLMSSGFTML